MYIVHIVQSLYTKRSVSNKLRTVHRTQIQNAYEYT